MGPLARFVDLLMTAIAVLIAWLGIVHAAAAGQLLKLGVAFLLVGIVALLARRLRR